MEALHRLAEAGQIEPGETLRVWVKGEWHEIELRTLEISESERPKRDPQTADLLRRATRALASGSDGLAESLFQRALERDPHATEALNNLGTSYARRGDHSQARQMWPPRRWSGLRKAELLAELVETFQWPEAIDRIVAELNDKDRTALRSVLAQGGQMLWTDFDTQFGNDLEESAYWQWHEPETTMGRLRRRGLLVETTVDAELLVAIPLELRQPLAARLGTG